MARRSVHMKKSVLSAKSRKALPASAFAVPAERKFPINDLYHGRLALIYVMSPSNAAYREEVVDAVLSRYPELRFFWESRSKNLAKRRRAAPAARIAANPSHSYEDSMPIYTLTNPLRYVDTPVIKVGPLTKSRKTGRIRIAGGSENHAMNPATGAAFCGAGLDRRGGMFGGSPRDGYIHPVKGDVVTCMRCIKLINMNSGEGIIERDLDAGARGKTAGHKTKMIRGGDEGPFVSANARFAGQKGYYSKKGFVTRRDAKGRPLRGLLGVPDFAERAFYDDRPSQTFGPKRGRIMVDDEAILAADMRGARPKAGGKRRKPAPVPQVAPVVRIAAGAEEYMDNPRRNPRSVKGSGYGNVTLSTAKGQTIREERYDHPWFGNYKLDEIALDMATGAPIGSIITIRDGLLEDRYKVVDAHLGNRLRGVQKMRRRNPLSEDGVIVNPSRGSKRRRSGGLAKGQSLMAQAAEAYHAGEYDSMQEALRGVSRRARRNPFTGGMGGSGQSGPSGWTGGRIIMAEGGGSDARARGAAAADKLLKEIGVESLPRPTGGGGSSSTPPPSGGGGSAGGGSTPPAKANPRRKGGKRRTAAQSNAALAMKLYHSGRARSLAEAWDMIRRGR